MKQKEIDKLIIDNETWRKILQQQSIDQLLEDLHDNMDKLNNDLDIMDMYKAYIKLNK
jgi:hypothetical protein